MQARLRYGAAMAQRVCPRDATALESSPDVLGPGAPALTCPQCAGISIDWSAAEPLFTSLGFTLTHVQQLVQQADAEPRKGPPAACTACGKADLKPLRLKGVDLDLCEGCGHLWFDRGELPKLTQGRLGAKVVARAPTDGSTSRVAGVYEMLWDCEYCQTAKLLAKSNRHCPSCGAAQNASKRYFPPEGEEVAANDSFDGADKVCPACSTPNGAKASCCRQCGSPLDGAAEVNRVADQSSRAPVKAAPAARVSSGRPWWVFALVGAALMLCCVCGVAATWTKDVAVEVTGHEWQRSIDIEAFEPVHGSDWCDSMPAAAYDVSRSKEQRSSRQIPDGETCSTRKVDRGDGTFEKRQECKPKYRSEPVYDMKCSYLVDRWHTARTVDARGSGTSGLRWPALSLRQQGTCRGC